jgi:hypothetical protein
MITEGVNFCPAGKAGKAKSGKSVKAGNEKRKSEKLDHRGH